MKLSTHPNRKVKKGRPAKARKNPLRADPTRTGGLRRRLKAALRSEYARLRADVYAAVARLDGFGLSPTEGFGLSEDVSVSSSSFDQFPVNTLWSFADARGKVEQFSRWLYERTRQTLVGRGLDTILRSFVDDGYRLGAVRSSGDSVRSGRAVPDRIPRLGEGQRGFVDGVLTGAGPAEARRALAGRAADELAGNLDGLVHKATRALDDGLTRGETRTRVAGLITAEIDKSLQNALTLADTEIVRAYAAGQLAALAALGTKTVSAVVEFGTAADGKVCPRCSVLRGAVYTLAEAQGVIPVHPMCRCAWVPARPTALPSGRNQPRLPLQEDIDPTGNVSGL